MPILNHAFNAGHSFNHLPFCNYQAFPPSLARSKSTISVFIAAARTALNFQNCLCDINFSSYKKYFTEYDVPVQTCQSSRDRKWLICASFVKFSLLKINNLPQYYHFRLNDYFSILRIFYFQESHVIRLEFYEFWKIISKSFFFSNWLKNADTWVP